MFETTLIDNQPECAHEHRIPRLQVGPPRKPTNMTEASRDPEVADPENNGRTALNLTCSTTNKSKPLPDRGTWSTKLDFILSVVMHYHHLLLITTKYLLLVAHTLGINIVNYN